MENYAEFGTALAAKGVTVYHCGISHTGKYVRIITDDSKETQKILMSTCKEVATKNDWNFDFYKKKTNHIDKNIFEGKTYTHVRNLFLPFKD